MWLCKIVIAHELVACENVAERVYLSASCSAGKLRACDPTRWHGFDAWDSERSSSTAAALRWQ